MPAFSIRPLQPKDSDWVTPFIAQHWGDDFIVARCRIFYPARLPGFIAEQEGQMVGLLTYIIEQLACEVITLDSLQPGCGIGTALLAAVKEAATQRQCKRLWLVTTNDNLDALRFYQRRGFVLAALHREAVTAARCLKPAIPLLGAHGIALRDEIELEMNL